MNNKQQNRIGDWQRNFLRCRGFDERVVGLLVFGIEIFQDPFSNFFNDFAGRRAIGVVLLLEEFFDHGNSFPFLDCQLKDKSKLWAERLTD